MEDDSKFSYFFLGLGLGVAAGLLFAPKSGPETRELIKTKAGEGGEYLKTKAGEGSEYLKKRSADMKDTANDLVDRGRSILNKQKDQLSQAVEAGRQAYRDTVGGPAEKHVPNEGI
jgi:gas vesicle protein